MVNRSEGRFQTKHGPTKHTGVGGYKTRALPDGATWTQFQSVPAAEGLQPS